MKTKWISIALSLALVGSAPLPALEYRLSCPHRESKLPDMDVVRADQLDETMLLEIVQGHHPELAIAFSKGDQLPLTFSLEGDFLQFGEQPPPLSIVLKRDIFIRYADKEFFFSSDGNSWLAFSDFFTGTVGVQVGVQELGLPTMEVDLTLNKR